MEQILQDSGLQLRDIIDFLPDATLAIDKEKRVIVWNHAIEVMTGVSAKEMIGQDGYAYTTPFCGEARPLLVELLDLDDKELSLRYQNVTRIGDSITGEIFCKSLYGNRGAWVAVKAAPLHDQQGNIIGAIEIVRDISSRKLAEAYRDIGREVLLLLNEPDELKGIIQRVIKLLKDRTGFDAVGIRLQDGEDFPYYSEEGFPKDLLLKEHSLIERDVDGGVCRDKDGNVCLECTCGLVITGKSMPGHPLFTSGGSFWTNDSFQLLHIASDQEPRHNPRNECFHHNYASMALVPIRNNERILGLIQFNDKRKDRFTLESVELLEVINSYIGAVLMHKQADDEKKRLEAQLHQAQKMESVGRLAGGVAHDFNNKLTIITGYVNLARMEAEQAEPIAGYLDEIDKAATKSADLTRQLLAFARKQAIIPRVLDLNETMSGMVKMLQRLIGEDIHVSWKPGERLWRVKMDSSQIDQILVNLCVNAKDAINTSGKIFIETSNISIDKSYCISNSYDLDGDYVCLTVSDDGMGMDEHILANIFEPFFTTKGIGEGTGLGLATVYGIVKQNNGFINVYSEPGHGTTFIIYMPRHADAVIQAQHDALAETPPLGHETVLVVEDELAILKMASMLLQKQGYNVLAAHSPSEAIRIAHSHSGQIDLLMTDVVMPEMNGKELATKLTTIHPHLKCIYMSGYTADVIAHHGVIGDDLHFIQKPFPLYALATKVREVLDSNWKG